MAKALSGSSSSSNSDRYRLLVNVLKKSLKTSTSQLDIDSLIQKVYGNDASIFRDDQLHSVMESLLENLCDTVEKDMLQYLENNKVEERLFVIDRMLQNLEAEDVTRKRAEQADKDRTERALQHAKLPDGISPIDLANYQEYQKLLQEQTMLQEDMDAVKRHIEQLETTKENRQAQVHKSSTKIQEVGQELEKAASLASSTSMHCGASEDVSAEGSDE